jgi:uncharacterized membrane protein (UPF0182 family)
MKSFTEKYRSLRCVAIWNEQAAAATFKQLNRTNNAYRRQELRRDGDRYTQNAMRINQTLARV